MWTAVEVDEEAKTRLDELQTVIQQKTGRAVTQQQLLSQLIDDAYQSQEDVVDSLREETVPLTDGEKEAMQQGYFSSGVETDEDDIDDWLYDSSPE